MICAASFRLHNAATGEREDFEFAWWMAWAKADNKVDEAPSAVRGRPRGTIHRDAHGDVWLLVSIPVTMRNFT